ncbi:uncharacterized protein V6R79_002650 [Siganus canaliculatus]
MAGIMNLQVKDTNQSDTVEKLKHKYLEKRKKMRPPEDSSYTCDDAVPGFSLINRSTKPRKELEYYNKALHDLFKTVTNHPDHDHSTDDNHQDVSEDSVTALQDSQLLFTETDVTLPSCLTDSPEYPQNAIDSKMHRAQQFTESRCSSSLVLANVYQEMMTIYQQLKTERQSQQQWEKELQERERRLRQQEEALGRLSGLEEMLHSRILAVDEKHQREVNQLQCVLRERNKENKRLKSSFDTIKELNDNMRKQLNVLSEQNKKLENQSKRVQARLENLQRKYEHSMASKVSIKSSECVKPSKKEKTTASENPRNKGSSSSSDLKLLALLIDWILDSSVTADERKHVSQCLPAEVVLNERCLKVLPLLADQLHTLSEPDFLLHLLRFIHWSLKQIDSSKQHAALSATLRRIGEELSKPPAVPQCEDLDLPKSGHGAGSSSSWTLYQSSCPHTRILSIIIILRTVTQADVLAQALDRLHTELLSEESRGLFLHYEGVCVLLSVIRAGRAGLHTLVNILMQLTEQSRYLKPFLDACSCQDFFQTASQLFQNPRLGLPSLEKLSMLLQKLSTVRQNRHLFELSSLHLQIQELYHKSSHEHTFLCLNLRSILHNLK